MTEELNINGPFNCRCSWNRIGKGAVLVTSNSYQYQIASVIRRPHKRKFNVRLPFCEPSDQFDSIDDGINWVNNRLGLYREFIDAVLIEISPAPSTPIGGK